MLEVKPGMAPELRRLAGPGVCVMGRTAGLKNGQQGRACVGPSIRGLEHEE